MVLFAAIVPFIVLSGTDNLTYRCTYVFTRCFMAAVPAAIWCYKDKQAWPWWRLMVTVLGFYVALVVIQMRGSHPP
ncbi:hypothetical protein [Prosthecobacter sp.]|uniref:hypothetical protein n=1 Tax=Prosthecobacter sp. TaxID=1965333 RepID=UPI0037849FE6